MLKRVYKFSFVVCCVVLALLVSLDVVYSQVKHERRVVKKKKARRADRMLVKDAISYIGLANAYRVNFPQKRKTHRQTLVLVKENFAYLALTFGEEGELLDTKSYKLSKQEKMNLIRRAKSLRRQKSFKISKNAKSPTWFKKMDDTVKAQVGHDIIGISLADVHGAEVTESGVMLNDKISENIEVGDLHQCVHEGRPTFKPKDDSDLEGGEAIDQVSDDVKEFPGFTDWIWDLYEKAGGTNPYEEMLEESQNGDDGGDGDGENGDGGGSGGDGE